MKITQEFDASHHIIKAYGRAGIVIGDQRFTGSVMVTADTLNTWSPVYPDMLNEQGMKSLAALCPEVVILGTGEKIQFPDISIQAFFMQQGIGFEVMDTAAACRTYNVLVSEGRKVAAALFNHYGEEPVP